MNSMNINDILNKDTKDYGYLFPFRNYKVPKIKSHIFADLYLSDKKADEYVVSRMMNLDYIGWTAKAILNIDLFPLQIEIIRTMWTHPLPMLIASRGGSKSYTLAVYALIRCLLEPGTTVVIIGAGLRQARLLFNYIEHIWHAAPVLRDIVGGGAKGGVRQNVDLCYFKVGESIIYGLPLGDGCAYGQAIITYSDCFGTISDDQPNNIADQNIVNRTREVWGNKNFRATDESYCNGTKATKKIKTSKGFEFEATYNHKLKILRNMEIQWIRMDEMQIGDRILIDRSWRWHNGTSDITKDEAYACGLLIGDGCFTYPDRISFATADVELLESMKCIGNFIGYENKKYEYYCYGKKNLNEFLNKFGIKATLAHEKIIPLSLMNCNRDTMSAFLRGLFDSDGGVQEVRPNSTSLGGMIRLTNTSKRLLDQVQYILLHYGIISSIKLKKSNETSRHQCYTLSICGKNVKIFYSHIGFGLRRKQNILEKIILEKKTYKDRDDVVPQINELMISISKDHKHNLKGKEKLAFNQMMCRIRNGKQSRSQAKRFIQIFSNIKDNRMEKIIALCDDDIYYDKIIEIKDSKCLTFDIHVPYIHEYCANGLFSHNTKIRGFRANVVIADEFASIREEVFDVVVQGFASTTKSPVEEAKKIAFDKCISQLNISKDIKESILSEKVQGNQIIHSGTAYYAFNHFARRHAKWKKIIESKGEIDKVAEIFGGIHNIHTGFDYRDYVIIRVPYNYLPEGMLEPKILAHAQASLPKALFQMEYGACFVSDSDGFFKRSLIESCTTDISNPIITSDGSVIFTPTMNGVRGRTYVMGIDPAAERDKFAITIIEVWPNHYRIVYCWNINKTEFNKRKVNKLIEDEDFYSYCCRKIRELVKTFNPVRIEMDSQGGGYAIADMLKNKKLLDGDKGDFPIHEIIDFDQPKPTDSETGMHILHLVQQSTTFNSDANVALHKSFETRTLLFPAFDVVQFQAALNAEQSMNITCDTFEECIHNIEELKNELCTIQLSMTATNKEKFDTPSVVTGSTMEGRQSKGRLRKDRYTSLLLAHKYIYDNETKPTQTIDYNNVVGNIKMVRSDPSEGMYCGPGIGQMRNAKEWSKGGANGQFGAVKREKKI